MTIEIEVAGAPEDERARIDEIVQKALRREAHVIILFQQDDTMHIIPVNVSPVKALEMSDILHMALAEEQSIDTTSVTKH